MFLSHQDCRSRGRQRNGSRCRRRRSVVILLRLTAFPRHFGLAPVTITCQTEAIHLGCVYVHMENALAMEGWRPLACRPNEDLLWLERDEKEVLHRQRTFVFDTDALKDICRRIAAMRGLRIACDLTC